MKRIVAFIVCAFLCLGNVFTVRAETAMIGTTARGAVLIEAKSGDILYEKNAHQVLQMASTTKIMTTLLCLESGNLDEYFKVDPEAIKVEGSSMGLKEDDVVTKRILCYGMMLPSGNDAANSTAYKLAGSIEKFSVLMNERAKKIGMHNTNFVTPSGLDDYTDSHYSTAYDMAILAREALKNDTFREICGTKNVKLEYGNPPYARWLANSNKLLSGCEGVIGVKTGFTDKARRCLVSACERNGVTLICVTLNDPDDWRDHKALYDYGFAQMKKLEIPFEEKCLGVNVVGGEKGLAMCRLSKPSQLTVYNTDKSQIDTKIIIPSFIYAPVNKGEIIGKVEYYKGKELIQSIPVMVNENIKEKTQTVEKSNIFKRIFNKIRD